MSNTTFRAPRYWPVHLALTLLCLLKHWPMPVLRAIGRTLGGLLWYLAGERRRIVQTNLALCFPHWSATERQRVGRECFALTGAAMLDLAPLWFAEPERIQHSVRIEGLERIAQLQAQGRGVIILGFHFNDLERGGIALAPHVQRLAAMYRSHANPVFEQAMRRGRERALHLIDRDDVRAMMKWLKTGGAIWYAADQDYGRAHSVFVPFFGQETATITALSRFAKMGNAVVLPLLHSKDGDTTVLQIGAPLPIPGANETEDARCVNNLLEQHLRQHPANYMWTHRRFKTRPEGRESSYEKRSSHASDTISAKRLRMLFSNSSALAVSSSWRSTVDGEFLFCLAHTRWHWSSHPQQRSRNLLTAWHRSELIRVQCCRHLRCDVVRVRPDNTDEFLQFLKQQSWPQSVQL